MQTHWCRLTVGAKKNRKKINELKLFTFAIFVFHSILVNCSLSVNDNRSVFLPPLSIFRHFCSSAYQSFLRWYETKRARTAFVCKVMIKMAQPARISTVAQHADERIGMERLAYQRCLFRFHHICLFISISLCLFLRCPRLSLSPSLPLRTCTVAATLKMCERNA